MNYQGHCLFSKASKLHILFTELTEYRLDFRQNIYELQKYGKKQNSNLSFIFTYLYEIMNKIQKNEIGLTRKFQH